MIGRTFAHYRVDSRLGSGGMGVVYAAHDLKLDRPVAVKQLHAEIVDVALRERLRREARAAAALNHPAICQVYDLVEEQGELFLVMERLDGETLADRAARGPLPARDVAALGVSLLEALQLLHRRGLVHRDLKPSNVFLLDDGRAKLMDFGLVRSTRGLSGDASVALTTGMVVGSPGYMSPEQLRGEPIDGRSDLFALSATLREALTGERVFTGPTPIEVLVATMRHDPPPIRGNAETQALCRVFDRALAKDRARRPADATAFAAEIRDALRDSERRRVPEHAPAPTRLAVLPFRMLRADPEREFLGPSLADAVAMSLSGIQSLLVRAPAAAARYAGDTADLAVLGKALDVDSVLVGTVLPVGDRCRVASQLVEVPSGRIVWSHTADVTGGDAFQLQDDLTRRIVESLRVPLSAGERRALSQDVPASPDAYELFLRANRASLAPRSQIHLAVDLYRRCLEADPSFAPAWARIGRCYRVQAKFVADDRERNLRAAEDALARALELHPDLPAAHHVHAYLEIETNRVEAAIERLIGVVGRNPNDPEGYAGLVSALRYAGFLDASAAADARARALAADMPTSVPYTLMGLGRFEEALSRVEGSNIMFQSWTLMLMGRRDEAIALADRHAENQQDSFEGTWMRAMAAGMRRDAPDLVRRYQEVLRLHDPEALIVPYMMHAECGLLDASAEFAAEALDQGYLAFGVYAQAPQFEDVRGREPMRSAWDRATRRQSELAARFSGRIEAVLRS